YAWGSPGALVKHSYTSVTGFVRPPYSKETTKPKVPKNVNPNAKATVSTATTTTGEAKKPYFKEITRVSYTSFSSDLDDKLEYI
ncbi:CHAP domain-containing protein, partial [Staphylococcus epidermidis]